MRYSKRLSKKAVWLVGLLVVVLSAGIVAITQIAGATSNPPGNNGTVKIHDVPLDSNSHNQPHVGCPFTVTFFGFDEGDVAEVTFTAWAPTGKGTPLLTGTVDIGADDKSGGGSPAGLDGEQTYTLDFDGIVPHEQQGFHVKLTVTVTSPGSETPKFDKYKVFWAQPCEESSTTTSTTVGETTTTVGETTTTAGETTTTVGETTTSTPQSTISPTTSTVGETTTTAGEETTTTAGETTTTAGETTTTAAGQTTTTAAGGMHPTTSGQGPSGNQLVASKRGRGGLPSTGANALPMIATGLLLALVGVGGLLVSRRLRAR
jgi:hypothetical protein